MRQKIFKPFNPAVFFFLGTIVITSIWAGMVWPFNKKFFFYADTQNGAYGIWYEIGKKFAAGQWPFFSSQGWVGGNHIVEGQWGLWNPMVTVIGIISTKMNDIFIFSACVKIFILCIGATGTFMLAKSYRANNLWAMICGSACAFAGFSFYSDATSWVTNLMIWAFLPWVWWATVRMVYEGKSPLVPFIFGYLLITIGYVHGTIMLICMYFAILIEIIILKRIKHLWKMILNGALLGLIAVTVYLPGVLTVSVTSRKEIIDNWGFMVGNLHGFLTAASPSEMPLLPGFWGLYTILPYMYIAWFLPLLAFIDFTKVNMYKRELSGLTIFAITSLLFTMAPSDIGPLRFPVRVYPFVALSVLVLFAVLMSRALPEKISVHRCLTALGLVGFNWYIAWSETPKDFEQHKVAHLLAMLGVILTWISLKNFSFIAQKWKWVLPTISLVGVSSMILVHQFAFFAPRIDDGPTNAPRYQAQYKTQLAEARGDLITIGNPAKIASSFYKETLYANNWYVNDKVTAHNVYSPVQYAAYTKDLCMGDYGETCSDLKNKLFTLDSQTRLPLVDLLSIDTLQIMNTKNQPSMEFLAENKPPAGWEVAKTYPKSIVWNRSVPLGTSGNVQWKSSEMEIKNLTNTDQEASFTVDKIPAQGGKVIFSRLNWPGYKVENGSINANPARNYLLTVDVPPNSQGKVVKVTFQPPGWNVELGAWIAAITGIILWTLFYVYTSYRKSKRKIEAHSLE